jgi:hypothetical protein
VAELGAAWINGLICGGLAGLRREIGAYCGVIRGEKRWRKSRRGRGADGVKEEGAEERYL